MGDGGKGRRIIWYRGKWALTWTEDGHRQRRSLGTDDRALAETRAGALWHSRRTVGYTTGALVNAYIDDREGEIASTATQRYAWKALKPTFDNILPEHIDETLCRQYARERMKTVSSATAHYELGLVRQAMNWAERKRLIDRAPFIYMPQKPPPRDKRLTKAEFRLFLEGCAAPHVRLFAIVAICTGARSNAILDLTWDRVDLDQRIIDLRRLEIRQTNKGRAVVPMNDRAYEALKDAQAGAQTLYVIEWAGEKVGSVKKAFQRASERSGIQCTPHMLRHSAATWMAEDGIPMSEIAQYLGHESTRVTEKTYARYSPTYLRRAAQALEW